MIEDKKPKKRKKKLPLAKRRRLSFIYDLELPLKPSYELLEQLKIEEVKEYKAKKRCPIEEDIQAEIIKYLDKRDILNHPSLSGIPLPVPLLNSLKRSGVKKGYPDLYIIKNNGKDRIFFLELKRLKGGNLSDEQKDIIKRIQDEGIPVSVGVGFFDSLLKIEKYLNGEPDCYTFPLTE